MQERERVARTMSLMVLEVRHPDGEIRSQKTPKWSGNGGSRGAGREGEGAPRGG